MTKKWERTANCQARRDNRTGRAGPVKQHPLVQKGIKLKCRHPEEDREGGRKML